MGRGLLWNAATPSPAPVVFMPIPLASPIPIAELPQPTPSPTATPAWPEIASSTSNWSDSEITGPQVFRFEYHYLLRGQTNPAVRRPLRLLIARYSATRRGTRGFVRAQPQVHSQLQPQPEPQSQAQLPKHYVVTGS